MHQEVVMNHYISAILMGEEIFKFYEEKAESSELKSMLRDFYSSFQNQREMLKEKMKEQGYQAEEECSFLQKNAIVMEKIKTSAIQNDFDLCFNVMKSMNGALINAMKYLNKCNGNISNELLSAAKSTLSNYDNIIGKVKNYVLKQMKTTPKAKKKETSNKTKTSKDSVSKSTKKSA